MKNKEELFIERINQKQRGAYRELFQEFYQTLVMFAMKYLGKREEAEDIVQDVFVTIWEKQERFTLIGLSGFFFIMRCAIPA